MRREVRLIPLGEYAARHGRDPSSARCKAERGGFESAVKIGRNWLIDPDEPYADLRFSGGKSVKKRPPR
jgi:hypothetical protein